MSKSLWHKFIVGLPRKTCEKRKDEQKRESKGKKKEKEEDRTKLFK